VKIGDIVRVINYLTPRDFTGIFEVVTIKKQDNMVLIYKKGFPGHEGGGEHLCRDNECWYVDFKDLEVLQIGLNLVKISDLK
jgi:hypothetical protein